MTLESVIQAAKARAEERCEACFWAAHPEMKKPMTYFGHTCDDDLAVVKDAMLATIGHARDKVTAQWTDVHTLRCIDETLALIERLFEGGKE